MPLYYFFGRCYGDAALRWVERKLGPDSKAISLVEHYFRRFSYALVAWSPNGIVSVMAGATRMRTRTFFIVAALGTVAKVIVVYYLGDVLSVPLHEIADFVGKYQWYLTPLTFTTRRGAAREPAAQEPSPDRVGRRLRARPRRSARRRSGRRRPGGYGVEVGFVSQSRVSAALHEKPWPPIPVPSRGS